MNAVVGLKVRRVVIPRPRRYKKNETYPVVQEASRALTSGVAIFVYAIVSLIRVVIYLTVATVIATRHNSKL